MRKTTYFVILILVAVIIAAFVSNPDEQQHRDAAKAKFKTILENTMSEYGLEKNILTTLGFDIGDRFVDETIKNYISSDNYFVCSTTKFNFDGKSSVIGIGAFGKVWISTEVDQVIKEELKKNVQKYNPLIIH